MKLYILQGHYPLKILTTSLFVALLLHACSTSKTTPQEAPTQLSEPDIKNPIFGIKGGRDDSDPLQIGDYPSLPAKPHKIPKPTLQATSESSPDSENNPTLTPHKPYSAPRSQAAPNTSNLPQPIIGTIFLDEEKNKAFNLTPPKVQSREAFMQQRNKHETPIPRGANTKPLLQAAPTPKDVSDWLVLMGPGGSALTVWALAQGNWIWGYSLIDSIGFGWARLWRFHLFQNNQVMIENGETNTCLNGYKNGVIHMACNPKNRYQRFELIPMSNGAVQIKNVGLNTCIEIPIGDIFGDFHKVNGVFLSRCATGSNLTQQFYIAPPTFLENPLYRR